MPLWHSSYIQRVIRTFPVLYQQAVVDLSWISAASNVRRVEIHPATLFMQDSFVQFVCLASIVGRSFICGIEYQYINTSNKQCSNNVENNILITGKFPSSRKRNVGTSPLGNLYSSTPSSFTFCLLRKKKKTTKMFIFTRTTLNSL